MDFPLARSDTGLPCSAERTRSVRSALYAGSVDLPITEKPEASVLTARRAAQHFRLSSSDDAYEHLYILIVRSSLGPSPPNAGRYTVASRFRCRSCERGYIFPRAPEQFVTSPLCLVGYVRWDARSDRVPPLQTIIFSSFTGRTPVRRLIRLNRILRYLIRARHNSGCGEGHPATIVT